MVCNLYPRHHYPAAFSDYLIKMYQPSAICAEREKRVFLRKLARFAEKGPLPSPKAIYLRVRLKI